MKCPHCSTDVDKTQNFCGTCGRSLTTICGSCHKPNPTYFRFCGNCGHRFENASVLLLDRAGVILEAGEKAAKVLEPAKGAVRNKPLSLFLEPTNLVLFYSHWNELLKNATPQSVEVALRSDKRGVRYGRLLLQPDKQQTTGALRVCAELNDITDQHHARQKNQDQQDVYELINLMVNNSQPVNGMGKSRNFALILEKICLLSDAETGVICRFKENEPSMVREFVWHRNPAKHKKNGQETLQLVQLKPIADKLRRFNIYEQLDLAKLPAIERDCWLALINRKDGAVLGEKIYQGEQAVGLIALAGDDNRPWSSHSKMLLRLAGLLLAENLPRIRSANSVIRLVTPAESPIYHDDELQELNLVLELDEVQVEIHTDTNTLPAAEQSASMHIVAEDGTKMEESLPLTAKDGSYTIVCPKCDRTEHIHPDTFADLGWQLRVSCPCSCTFRIFRELRSANRKDVDLEGHFAENQPDPGKLATSNSWGPIRVTNLSKTGLRFTTERIEFLQLGQQIRLKFNLDNDSHTPIEKNAEVISLHESSAGCRFLGKDRYDVTLGFYFL